MHLKERAIDPTKLLRVKGGISIAYDNLWTTSELKSQALFLGFAWLMKCTNVGQCALFSKKEPVGMKG
jgi:hypothetical protein